jgi:aquaporin Z
MNKSMKECLAELFGTFLIVLFGCGSAVLAGANITFTGISLAFGLAVVAGAYSVGHISGGHFNPAVTLGLVIAGRTPKSKLFPYMLFQTIGAILAAFVLRIIASDLPTYNLAKSALGSNGYNFLSPMKYGLAAGVIFELVFTAVFVLVILGATRPGSTNPFAGLVIGLTLTAIHLVGIPVTGVSINPARSIGPALMSQSWPHISQLWMFIGVPLIGGFVAGVIWNLFFDDVPERSVVESTNFDESTTGTLEILPTAWGSIINDSYNANNNGVINALLSLDSTKGKKIVVLDDILELGTYAYQTHKEIAIVLSKIAPDVIILVGRNYANIILETLENLEYMGEVIEAIDIVPAEIVASDITALLSAPTTILLEGYQSQKYLSLLLDK